MPLRQHLLARFSAKHLSSNTKRVAPLRKPPHGAKSGLSVLYASPSLRHGVHESESRERRLRRDRVVVVVGDVLTADHDRLVSTCGVATAAKDDAALVAAGGVVDATEEAGKVGIVGGGVAKTAADAGGGATGGIRLPAADAGLIAVSGIEDTTADAGTDTAGGVADAAANAGRLITDRVLLTCDKATKGSIRELIVHPDHQVVRPAAVAGIEEPREGFVIANDQIAKPSGIAVVVG
jgi:hypothetical protein